MDTQNTISDVQNKQIEFIKGLDMEGLTVNFDDKIVLAKDCFQYDDLYMHRLMPTLGDSGWYIGPKDVEIEQVPENYDAMTIRDFMIDHPNYSVVLLLPAEYMAIFKGGELQTVVDGENTEAWKKK